MRSVRKPLAGSLHIIALSGTCIMQTGGHSPCPQGAPGWWGDKLNAESVCGTRWEKGQRGPRESHRVLCCVESPPHLPSSFPSVSSLFRFWSAVFGSKCIEEEVLCGAKAFIIFWFSAMKIYECRLTWHVQWTAYSCPSNPYGEALIPNPRK